MKVLICGLGGTGRRHMNNIESLGVACEDIMILRTRKGVADFGDKVLEEHGHRHTVFNDIDIALAKNPNIAFITNPTSLHVPVAQKAAEAGCHLFIEKPLSHTMDGVDQLIETVRKNGLTAFVAYNRRFHPMLLQIRNWLDKQSIGKVMTITAEMSDRVTDYHPWEDFKISCAVRSDLGGGVILGQCHELDYLYWIFGKPEWLFAAAGELGDFETGVDDTCISILKFNNNIIASLHIDFLKRPQKGLLEISGTKGRIHWNYFEKTLELIPIGEKEDSIKYQRPNDKNSWMASSFNIELEYFLNCVNNKIRALPDLEQGKDVLEMILATKKSFQTKKVVYL